MSDPVIIGAGLAGLMTALHLAPRPVLLLSRSPLGTECASAWAQGGIAAAIGADDHPDIHLADTLAAGDGLCDAEMARSIIQAAPGLIEELAARHVAFDRAAEGGLALGLEAGHSRRRIVHATGDGTGRDLVRALIAAVRATPSITVWEEAEAIRLLVHDNAVTGLLVRRPEGPVLLRTGQVVIATGGIGGLYRDSTNPGGAIGQGQVLAARAGAVLADLEFVQFHPTALDVGCDPMPLVSEAVRGEGARLIDERGIRFLEGHGREELEPRDVVSRAVWQHMGAGHRVFLDARAALGPRFAARFPGIAARCLQAGIDPAADPIPIRPAAHYHMGGIAVDAEGRSTVDGLWACGEAACTGLHGANRLASNSLLEAALCGRSVAGSVAATPMPMRRRPGPVRLPATPPDPAAIRPVLSRHCGVIRDAGGLRAAVAALMPLASAGGPSADPASLGLMLAVAMLRREESRGGHARSDFPGHAAGSPRRTQLTLEEALRFAATLGAMPEAERLRA